MNEEFKPRNVALVSVFIEQELPEDQNEFKKDIREFIMSLAYVAPEIMFTPTTWIKLELIIKRHINESDYPWTKSPWKQKIVDIFVNKTPLPEKYR